jgi:hypothetical protein
VTYARELAAAVTAFGSSTTLLDVQGPQLAARGLDDPGPVRGGVVAARTKGQYGQRPLHDRSLDKDLSIFRDSTNNSRVAAAVGDSVVGHCD